MLGPILATVALCFGSQIAVGLLLALIAAAFILAGVKIANAYSASRWYGIAIGAAMLYSPWTYEKVVAGHLGMVLAASACALLASELLSTSPRAWIILLCSYVAAFQIQFGILVVALSATVRFERRSIALTIIAVLVSFLPTIIGVAFGGSRLLGIPYTSTWQYANSVAPIDSLLLDGYSQRYTTESYGIFQVAAFLLAATGLVGLFVGLRRSIDRPRAVRMLVATVAILAYASGLRGVFAPLYAWSLQFRPTLVFRELFDLIGIVLVYYVLFASFAVSRFRWTQVVIALCALGMISGWLVSPPSHWWVPSERVPRIDVRNFPPNQRFALLPWHQPLELDSFGSGSDPDDYARANNVVPVNEYEDQYPSNVALAAYSMFGDPRDLEALSVSRVYLRPRFSTNLASIRQAIPVYRASAREADSAQLNALPEMSIVDSPPVRATFGSVHDLYLFCGGDPAELARYLRIATPPIASSDPDTAWVNAAIVFSTYPEIANPIGGVFTIDPRAVLSVPPDFRSRALVFVKGDLIGDRSLITRTTGTWRWVDLHGTTTLSCHGECAVSAWQRRPCPLSAPAAYAPHTKLVTFTQVLPFMAVGHLPVTESAAGSSMLLFRTRFDRSWTLLGVPGARHVEVNGVFNGYVIRNSAPRGAFLLIEMTALAQSAAMLISVLALAMLVKIFYFTRLENASRHSQ